MKLTAMLLALIFFLPLTGCGPSGGGSFTYNLNTGVKSLDPQTAVGDSAKAVLTALFEGLCRPDSKGKAGPGAAESWSSNESFTSYTFKLRNGLKWADGTELTAEDFVFALRRAADPATKATELENILKIKNAREVNSGKTSLDSLGVSAPDNKTVVIDLEKPDENFPLATADIRFMPCNSAFFASTTGRYGLQKSYLLTNGPFALSGSSDWNKEISLAKSKSYIGSGSVKPKSLTFMVGIDEVVAADPVTALIQGNADILPLDYTGSVAAAAAGSNIISFDNKTTGLIFNTASEPLNDKALRELFIKTIDRAAVLSVLPENLAPTDNIIPDNVLWGDEAYRNVITDDMLVKNDSAVLESMESVLKSLELDIIPSISILCRDDDSSKAIANKIIISWNGIMGNYFNIQPVGEHEFNSKINAGDYQLALYTVTAGGNTPYSFLKAFESTASPKLLESPDFDSSVASIDNTAENFGELEQYLHEEYYFYPIHKQKTYFGLAPKVKGINLQPGYIDFRNATK